MFKKRVMLLLMLVLVLAFSACGQYMDGDTETGYGQELRPEKAVSYVRDAPPLFLVEMLDINDAVSSRC